MRGMFLAKAKAFAKEVPTNKDPNKPGPREKATASISFLCIFASTIDCSTAGIIFC